MADTPESPAPESSNTAERIAKVIARSGVASRRDAEKMILVGRVAVNGKRVDTPALDVTPADKVTIDGTAIDAPQETRVWLYYKPLGLVTTEKDEQGRRTIFDEMPEGMPRVLNIGRLDLNSEGLLLLTNDGGLKRRLELPETGWLRKYRVRVNGRPMSDTFNPLREGITLEGEDFQPMEVTLDRQQGANAWLTVGIREGRNREIRRAMAAVGMVVNRLIRVSYGPFRLNEMQPGDVMEVKRKLLRDQLGDRLLFGVEDGKPSRAERMAPRPPREGGKGFGKGRPGRDLRRPRDDAEEAPQKGFGRQRDFAGAERKPRAFGTKSHHDGEEGRKPYARREDGERKPFVRREGEEGKRPYKPRAEGDKKPFSRREDGDRKPYARREDGERKPFVRRDGEEGKRPYKPRAEGDKKPFSRREDGDRKPYARREDGERKPFVRREGEEGKRPYKPRAEGDKKPFSRREDGDRKPYARREDGDKPFKRSGGDKPGFKSAGFKSHAAKPGGKPRSEGFKSHDRKPGGFKGPRNGKPGAQRD